MRPFVAWTFAAAALAAAVAVAVVIGRFWNGIGATDISPVGWLAMGFGIFATAALGMGLMALMFFSSRHGYDDAPGDDGEGTMPAPRGGGSAGEVCGEHRRET